MASSYCCTLTLIMFEILRFHCPPYVWRCLLWRAFFQIQLSSQKSTCLKWMITWRREEMVDFEIGIDYIHGVKSLLSTVVIVVYTYSNWNVSTRLAISRSTESNIARGSDEASGSRSGIPCDFYIFYFCFQRMFCMCVCVSVCVVESLTGCRRLMGVLFFPSSDRVSPALKSVCEHTWCDNLQLWGCESANEIPFQPV